DRYDDVGIFDSLLLANPYRAILGMAGSPSDLNIQRLDGSELPAAALRGAGVRFVVTPDERPDLDRVSETDDAYLYRVSDPAPRASFFATMPRRKYVSYGSAGQNTVAYLRPSSDEI